MFVIGICGKAGAGKNTVGGMLAGILAGCGLRVVLDSFALGVKRQAMYVLDWDGVDKSPFWREALQRIGAAGRQGNAGCWIDELLERNPKSGCDILIVTDVRYVNEAAFCERRGLVVCVDGRGGLTGDAALHPSEAEVDGVFRLHTDHRIDNSGDIEFLLAQVTDLAVTVRKAMGGKRDV